MRKNTRKWYHLPATYEGFVTSVTHARDSCTPGVEGGLIAIVFNRRLFMRQIVVMPSNVVQRKQQQNVYSYDSA